MKLTNFRCMGVVCLIIAYTVLFVSTAKSQTARDKNRTLSPYFAVKSDQPDVDCLPLKSTKANVTISGIIADVTITQTYYNAGKNVLEAIYVFPASTEAAVYYMQMEIGERTLYAKIKEKQQAREEYEEAKEEGKTVSLLEQDRPNIFQMNVANILPGDTINIVIKYTELITPVEGIYEFVYPTVVLPRYTGEDPDTGEDTWLESPYTHEGESPSYDFDITVTINAGMKLSDVTCVSHEEITFYENSPQSITCDLNDEAKNSGNKDFILQYSLCGDGIESGLLLFEGEEENFFLALVQPPKQPKDNHIPPREYIFIMDVSGSMSGYPIETSKELLNNLLYDLKTNDKFNIMFFSGGSQLLSTSSLDATPENICSAFEQVEKQSGGGGTNILSALEIALNLPEAENFARSFVITTDGGVSVDREVFDLIRNNLNRANFFPFGIGAAPNRYIIEGIAHMGMTEPFIVSNESEASDKADLFRKYIEKPVLTNIDLEFEDFTVYDVEPLTVPDVLAERPVMVFGKYTGEANGKIKLSGVSGTSIYSTELDVSHYHANAKNSALIYLWARHKLKLLADYGDVDYTSDVKEEITNLGLKYNLLTEYTSFIAVDTMIRNTTDTLTTVKQPLPLPVGVSDFALGGMEVLDEEIFYSDVSNSGSSFIKLNYPNPFMGSTKLKIFINEKDFGKPIKIEIYNSLGQFVKTVDLSYLSSGWQDVEVNLGEGNAGLTSGLYFVRLFVDEIQTSNLTINFAGH